MLHLAKAIREFRPEFKEHRIAFIGPCLSKRREFDEAGGVEYNVTFNSLITRLKEKGVSLSTFPAEDYDNPPAERAALFSTPGGLLETLKRWKPDAEQFTHKVEGPAEVYKYLSQLESLLKEGKNPLLVDCLNCVKGCNGGPGTPNRKADAHELQERVKKRALSMRKRWEAISHNGPISTREAVEMELDNFWKEGLYGRSYVDRSSTVLVRDISPEEKSRVLFAMGIKSPAEESNCGGCGYKTCAAYAKALVNNRARAHYCRLFKKKRVELLKEELIELKAAVASAPADLAPVMAELVRFLDSLAAAAATKSPSPGKQGMPFSDAVWYTRLFLAESDPQKKLALSGRILGK
jgi:hypothetical protein